VRARYAHTNLVARDWRELAAFYETVFGCVPVPPERDFSGPSLEALTGLDNAGLRGMHLRLPGYGEGGPTLEIFEYRPQLESDRPAVNRFGFGHIAFQVDDVGAALQVVIANGGSVIGETVRLGVPGAGFVTAVYARDPEGNILELQRWS
jgi:predicted enzyme related to lactoylglutathione lyase